MRSGPARVLQSTPAARRLSDQPRAHRGADRVPAALRLRISEHGREAEGPVEQAPQVAAPRQRPQGRGALDLEGEADAAHQPVERGGPLVPGQAASLRKPRKGRIGDLPAGERGRVHAQHRAAARLAVDAQDVDLVGVARDDAEEALALGQVSGKAQVAMVGNGLAHDVRPCAVLGEGGQLLVEDAQAEHGVAAGCAVVERAPAAQLLEPADVVQKAAEPR